MKELNTTEYKLVIAHIYVICSYIFALFISIIIGFIFRFLHPLILVLIADLAGTIVIYIIGMIAKNSSFYDPYWSVAPIIIASFYIFFPYSSNVELIRKIIIFILISVWSVRLTFNWIRQWKGLKHEDWRYSDLRIKYGKNFWFFNLIGVHLMPTFVVYLGTISLYPALSLGAKSFGVIDIIATAITLIAIVIETLADQQLHNFRKTRENPQQIITRGLWAFSRHPNYFGEILFWWGLFIFALSANLGYFWAITGPFAITLLFNVLSIPLMEERNLNTKPEYARYKERVSKLILWFPRK